MDKISVILPVYKVEKYIDQCMETVLNQTYQNLEIILVDDGSPDNCGKICDRYAEQDERVIVIHKKNGGAPAARNDALKIATGDWIAYVDPDDWIEKNTFEEAVAVGIRDGSDIVIFNTYLNSNEGDKQTLMQAFPEDFTSSDRTFIRKMQLSSLSSKYTPLLQNWSQGFPWDKIYRADFTRKYNILWPTNLKANDDVVYTIHAFEHAKKITYINKTFYHYRMNPQSIGHKFMPDRVKVDHDIYAEMYKIKEEYGLSDDYEAALNARIILNVWLCLGRCFFHPENKKSLREKFSDISDMLKDEYIKKAFINVDRSKLDRRVRYMAKFKHPKPVWLYMVYKAFSIKKKITG